jgi:hypothetical protein
MSWVFILSLGRVAELLHMLCAVDFAMEMGLFSPAKEFAPMRLEVWHEFYVAAPDRKQLLVHVVGCFDDPVLGVVEPSPAAL